MIIKNNGYVRSYRYQRYSYHAKMGLVALILIIGIIEFGLGIWVYICLCITLFTIQTLTQLTTLTLPILLYCNYHYLQYTCYNMLLDTSSKEHQHVQRKCWT